MTTGVGGAGLGRSNRGGYYGRMAILAPTLSRPALTRVRCLAADRRAADVAGVGALIVLTAVGTWPLVVGGTLIGQDSAAFFYPIFVALGERLRALDVPGWNPHQFAGVPFAADPESGWMYLPAMLLFALLPLAAAAPAWIVFHLLLAGLGAYALGRTLGLGVLGALAAAVAYEFSGMMFARTVCCPAYSQVAAWLPAVLLTTELAMRARGWGGRVAWWGAAGFGLSQIFVAWLGQGSYYALLAFGAYVLLRTANGPDRSLPWRTRLARLPLHGAAPAVVGLGLGAAALLPRLVYHARTNLAEGYTGNLSWAATLGGWDPEITVGELLRPTFYYAGGATLALAVVGLVLARTRHAAPFFAVLTIGAVVLAQREATWLHRPLYALLPRFEELHRHWPERDMTVFYLGPALLAGAAVQAAGRWQGRGLLLAVVAVGPVLLALALDGRVAPIGEIPLRAAFVVGAGLLVVANAPRLGRRVVPALLVLTLFVDLFAIGRYNLDHGLYGGFHKVDLPAFYETAGVDGFLRSRRETDGEPSRFFGYDPGIHPGGETPALYRYLFADPRAGAVLVNNRATILGLEDIQGYNPIQPQRYVEYMEELNGFAQEYHEANVYPSGVGSPLIDLLNVRYILVPAEIPPGRPDLDGLLQRHATVYADERVRVLENRGALPRAWLVHEAMAATPDAALRLLASGGVDPRRVALLEAEPPAMSAPAEPSRERVTVTRHEPDEMRLDVVADAPGLLVLSETIDPDWRAEVDGRETPIITANGLLRAVPVPVGRHAVELRYASRTLQAGLALSFVAYGGLAVVWGAAGWRWWRTRRSIDRPWR